MIKLEDITHEDSRGNRTYVVPGGIHFKSAFRAMERLEDMGALKHSSVPAVAANLTMVSKVGAKIVHKQGKSNRYFLGV